MQPLRKIVVYMVAEESGKKTNLKKNYRLTGDRPK